MFNHVIIYVKALLNNYWRFCWDCSEPYRGWGWCWCFNKVDKVKKGKKDCMHKSTCSY